MRDVDPPIARTLHRAEHPGTGGGTLKTNIEDSLKRTTLVLLAVPGELVFTVGFNDALEGIGKAELGECAAGEEEAGSVGSGPVCEAVFDAVAGELMGVGCSEDFVAGDLGGDDLGDYLKRGGVSGVVG